MSRKKNKSFTILSIVTLIMLIAVEVLTVLSISKVGLVPQNYLIMGSILLGLVTLIIALMMFIPSKKKKRRKVYTVRRSVGIMLTVVVAVACLAGSRMLTQLDSTVKTIVAPKSETATFAVYVMENDSAKEIADAANYVYAICDSYDGENLQKSLTSLQTTTGVVPQTVNKTSVFEAVDALYAGEVNGLIMSEAYVPVLEDMEDQEDYANFNNKTRVLYEISVEIENTATSTVAETDQTLPAASSITEPFIMYLSGSDTREQTLEVSRSDTNILFVCNPQTREILLVNTPRDYYVENPAKDNGYDKLTHCGLYGIPNSMAALGNLYGVTVNHYVQINFTGFETLVDAIGGIELTVDETIYTNEGVAMLQPGTCRVDGAHALVFARLRKTLADGDNDRGKNQMKVIKAIINQATATNVLANYSGILSSLEGMFDTSVSYDQIAEFIKLILQDTGTPWNINSYAVTGTGGMNTTASTGSQSLYVTYPDAYSVASASMLINEVLSGTKLTEADVDPTTAIEKAKADPVYGNVEQKTFTDTASTSSNTKEVDEDSITYDYSYSDNSSSNYDYDSDYDSGSSSSSSYDYDYDYDSGDDYGGGDYSGGGDDYSGGGDSGGGDYSTESYSEE